MRLEWSRKQTYLTLITIFVVSGISFLLYYQFLLPQKRTVSALENQLKTEEQIVKLLREEYDQQDIRLPSTRALQEELPVKKAVDQLLISLEHVELSTNSFIESIRVDPVQEENRLEGEEEVTPQLPEDLSTLTLELSVASESYFDFIDFLKELKSMQRFITIQSLSFNDDRLEENGTSYYYYFVTIQAYYFPSLKKLADEMPEYHYMKKSKKLSPFYYEDGTTHLEEQ